MEEVDKEILETFRKVEVNIPLLDALKQIPRYAKFLKELCTHKRKLKGNERISMGRNVSALIGKFVPHIPQKCKDPDTFYVPCIIGKNNFKNAMLDLGASVSVMPLSIFNSLSLGPSSSSSHPTVQPSPTPELKPLPENLKYAYLEDNEKFTVIIYASLTVEQEDKLLLVLNKHKKAIGWTLADIPDISPSTCMHRILLED